jgi:HEAT repeat protein
MKKVFFLSVSAILLTSTVFASGLPRAPMDVLIKSLQDSNLEVRTSAAKALIEMPDSSATKPLETALIASADAAEQDALVKALEAINDRATAKRLSDALGNPQFTWGTGAKARAVEVVGKIGDRKMIKWLTDLASSDQEPAIRAAAIRALGELGAPPKKPENK